MTNIEFIRRNMGLSQTELCRRIGLNPTSLVQVERGYRKPWPKFRLSLAAELNVPETELFDVSGWPLRIEK